MMQKHLVLGPCSTPRSRRLRAGAVATVGALLLGGVAISNALHEPDPAPPANDGTEVSKGLSMKEKWQEVDQQIDEQKFEAAHESVLQILDQARDEENAEEWARALIRAVQLRTGLHGYETSVRFLAEESWPEDPVQRTALDLFLAGSLRTYFQAYSWEIQQREQVVSSDEIDLKKWDREQIYQAAMAAFGRAWERREAWGTADLGPLAEFVVPNSYPQEVRGTLRDTVTYLWVEFLADSAWWSPAESNDLFRLDRDLLLEAETSELADSEANTPDSHPLLRVAALLADLEAWHEQGQRPEAAFEARRVRLERMHGSLTSERDRSRIRGTLEAGLERLSDDYPWWSTGMATLAEMVRQQDAPEALVEARSIAQAGAEAHPGTIGAQRCEHLVASIEAPSYQLHAMQLDGRDRRSIQILHQNLEALYFRAYPVAIESRLRRAKDYNLLPRHREIAEMVEKAQPVAEWSVSLPATPDYRQHTTYVVPELSEPGLYTVIASARASFEPERNQMNAVNLLISDLVLVSRTQDNTLEVTARSGRTGFPVAEAEISLYRFDWQKGHRVVARGRSDHQGRLDLELPTGHQHFLYARWHDQESLDPNYLYPSPIPRAGTTSGALLFTDRSVYRPHQKVRWKVVPYRGGGEHSRFETLSRHTLTVSLLDANQEEVSRREVRTNEYGTAAGEFEIPSGRLLGGWTLRSSVPGQTHIRVEEYKRPTFEVALKDPEESLRLNHPAQLTGEAKYYFGLPVTGGEVRWQVTREPLYPWWWYWRPRAGSQTLAVGSSQLGAEGEFTVRFTPEAEDLGEESRDVTYRYRLSAEVTDEGGETRSAERSFRLGFVGVEAHVVPHQPFILEGETGLVDVRRRDLDGHPRAGLGHWQLFRLEQPTQPRLPGDLPISHDGDRYKTEGDQLSPRWLGDRDLTARLASWPTEGEAIAGGRLDHDEDGGAELEIGRGLTAGAYRLEYRTEDQAGQSATTRHDLLVLREGMTDLALPALLLLEQTSVEPGGTARLVVYSGLARQELVLDSFRRHRRVRRRLLDSGQGLQILEIPIDQKDRGGYGFTLSLLRDHQLLNQSQSLFVPWTDRELSLEFGTFRDRLRPGDEETWSITVKGHDEELLGRGAAEVLAYMYDRSLDLFAPHSPTSPLVLYPHLNGTMFPRVNLAYSGTVWWWGHGLAEVPGYPALQENVLQFYSSYGIGGMGRRNRMMRQQLRAVGYVGGEMDAMAAPASASLEMEEVLMDAPAEGRMERAAPAAKAKRDAASGADAPATEVRTNFAETAFWEPQLLTDEDGAVRFQFTVPDSVTEWNVWVHALTKDLRGGATQVKTRTVKELLVRPYVPRFLREGDRATLRVQVDNAGDEPLQGVLDLEIFDPASTDGESDRGVDLLAAFSLSPEEVQQVPFEVAPGESATLTFPLAVPTRVGPVAFRTVGRAGAFSDGELRSLPVLPSRMHLIQSRFATLHDEETETLHFADLAAGDDPSLISDQLVVTIDAQLFYQVLDALPYLIDYPYECTEQTLNRFLSSGIVSSVFDQYPAVARMARQMAERDTPLQAWNEEDPNRQMALVETPWLRTARGGESDHDLIKILDPRIAEATRRDALGKLQKAQTSLGAFPWWPGGPPSPYMTLYLLHGFSRALEFDVEVPQPMVRQAWSYMHRHYIDELVEHMMDHDCCWEFITFLNYVLSSYPDESWTGGVFTAEERSQMLDFSFRHWKDHSPLLKGMLTLTLERSDRHADAVLVFDSVMDSAKTTDEDGTYWAPEDRAWLWYNDTIESHSFALRVLGELDPDDSRRHGLVQWLLINKKLGHWKSTRATAETIYSLVHYLDQEQALGQREAVSVLVADRQRDFVFEPDEYTGRNNQWVIPGEEVTPQMATIEVSKETPGFLFASATWHFSTEKLPEAASGDLFEVRRSYFQRVPSGDGFRLIPIDEAGPLAPGDQVEVHLSVRSRHAAEYVHLRDPRGAGFEPESLTSGYKWELGLGRYEETRDSGTNFFFEWLPAGEYTLKYRLRANMEGTFRVGPATMQSMYAPEFAAYSSGKVLEVGSDQPR